MKKDRREFLVRAKKERRPRKKLTKKVKVILLSCIAAVLCLTVVGLCLWFFVFKKEAVYQREYHSVESFTKAERLLTLAPGLSVTEYDVAADVFVVESTHREEASQKTVTLYGFIDKEGNYISPRFNSVISIKGDYAIVTQTTAADYLTGKLYVGLVKFRGEGVDGTPLYVTDFSISYTSTNPEQFYFCGEYLCVMGDLDVPSSQASYCSFYEYKEYNQPLFCFRVRYGYDAETGYNYTYMQYDRYLVAKGVNKAFFFDIDRDYVQGYLELSDACGYTSPYAKSEYTTDLSVLYMGNGWFVRYAAQTSTAPFEHYKFCYQSIDISGSATLVFARTVTDFFNVKTGITKNIPQVFAILEVANKYTRDDFAATANSYNNNVAAPDDYPCMNPADMMEDGYSILYYFYQPYIERTDFSGLQTLLSSEAAKTYDSETLLGILQAQGKETFCILDKNMNVIDPETMLPVVTVDGTGFETADPYFDINFGDGYFFTEKGKKTVFYADAATQYAVVGAKGKTVTVASLDVETAKKEDGDDTGIRYGAATTDGKIIVDCVYNRLSAFYGGYAIGAKIVGQNALYYQIDEMGNETQLLDVHMVRDGVYVYGGEEDKYGLKNYAGEVLLEATYDSIALSDNYMVNGVYQISYVITVTGNVTEIFILE